MALLMFPLPAGTLHAVRSALTAQVAYLEGSPSVTLVRAKADISSGPVLGGVLSGVIQL